MYQMIIAVDAFAAVVAVGIVCSCFVSEYIFPLAVVDKLDYHPFFGKGARSPSPTPGEVRRSRPWQPRTFFLVLTERITGLWGPE